MSESVHATPKKARQRNRARAEIAGLRAQLAAKERLIEEAKGLMEELAADVESACDNLYRHDNEIHPAYQRKYDRDMKPVFAARDWLRRASGETD